MSTCAASMSGSRTRGAMTARVRILVAVAMATIALAPACTVAEERNLAAASNGAQGIKYTSEQGGAWRVGKLIDEHPAPGGWASARDPLPQEIVVRLAAPSRFNTLVFNLDSGAPEMEWARDVSVYAADPFPTMGGWRLVASVRLDPH